MKTAWKSSRDMCRVKGRRHINDDSLLSNILHISELILELNMETDSDWSRWTLQELEISNLVRSEVGLRTVLSSGTVTVD